MEVAQSSVEIPTWVVVLLAVLVGMSFVYGIVVMQSLFAPVALWLGVVSLGALLSAVYLFYRLVVAVEKIADTL